MTGTFIDETLQIESLVIELVNDFSDKVPSTDIDIADYFYQLIKLYQLKNQQSLSEMCEYLYKHSGQSVSTDKVNESM